MKEVQRPPLTWRDIMEDWGEFYGVGGNDIEDFLDRINLRNEDGIWLVDVGDKVKQVVLTTVNFMPVAAFQEENGRIICTPLPGIDQRWITRGSLDDKFVLF